MCVLLECAPLEGDLATNYGPSPRRPPLLTDCPAAEFKEQAFPLAESGGLAEIGRLDRREHGSRMGRKPSSQPGRRGDGRVLFTPATSRTRSAGGRARTVFSR